MQLQKLSFNVNRRVSKSVRRIITGLCAGAGLIVLGIILFYTVRDNSERVQLYGSQISSKMQQKAALIDSVAAGAPVGSEAEDSLIICQRRKKSVSVLRRRSTRQG